MAVKRADLHLHTRFSQWKHLRIIHPRDSYTDPLAAWQRCRKAGMDFVAFTDHESIDGALDLLSRRPELEPQVIVGEEVETWFPDTNQWIHVNVFDIDEAVHREITRLRPNAFELVAYLNQNRIFHVLNHPFQSYRLQQPAFDYLVRLLDLFEFFELGNGTQTPRQNHAVAELINFARQAGFPRKLGVGGSDAHNLRDIALFCTEAEVPDGPGGGKQEWLAAVSRGEGRVVGRSIGVLRLTANVYTTISRYYKSLLDAETRRDMTLVNYAAAAMLVPVCMTGLPALMNLGNSLRLEAVTAHVRRRMRLMAQEAPEFLEDPLD